MNGNELFTGERFIPGIDDSKLEIEHYQRYLSVRKIVEGKVVVDAACGEGYGSNMLAASAKQVTGIDIDADTIRRAKQKYSEKNNLSFIEGSIENLTLEDKSVDVVVSFETIEHVPEQVQKRFLAEAARVLKEDGILIMSTPNKKVYSDLHNYKNEFHIKEFYHDEFLAFLKEKFPNVKLFNQSFQIASVINSCEGTEKEIAYYSKEEGYRQGGKYYIAAASKQKTAFPELSSVYINESDEYEENIQRIITLQQEEERRNRHIEKLDEEAEKAGELIRKMQKEEEERNAHIKHLDAVIAQKEELLSGQNEQIASQNEQLVNQETQIKEYIAKNQQAEKKIADLEQIVRNKEGHIELLLEVERAYEREKKTHAYKLAKRMQKIGDFLLPPDSRRRFFARILYNLFRHPKLMLHVINPKRIKNYLKYMKKEGMAGVKVRYEEAVAIERMRTNPESRLELETLHVADKRKNGEELRIEDFEELIFPVFEMPEVSIIIPVYNEFQYTYNCLKSILKNSGDVTYEVIIANDCSTDITKDMETIVKNIRLITTKENVRFLLNCNHAAGYAKGKYLLFLNNDTQVQPEWLKPLVKLIESNDRIGMVGSKFVYPDGLLQEAGGIVWKDASAWNYGNRKNPEDAEYNYVKEADYISGAGIMIKAHLWKEIGGFDERFVPAYYEDTDLAFEVRKRGYKVMYQPLSVIVHFEGVSNGTDVESGLKHYQQVNFEKFYEKWKDVLADHEANAENVFTAKDRSSHKKHILVVDHYVPHHDQDAGGKCTYMYLKLFVKMGFQVTFIGDNFFKHEPYTTELNQMGIEVLYGNYYYNNWEEWLKENAHYFDYIYLQRPHIAVKYIDLARNCSKAKILYFAHDLHHIREYREYEMTKNPEKLEASEHWKKIEYELFEKADVGHVVGSYEQEIMQKAFPGKPIRNIPLYIYESLLSDINKDFAARQDLLYVGGFGHPPNIDAVLWFAREVFPKILQKYPQIKWHVVGGKVPKEIAELASENIIIEGFVSDEDLEKLYRTCRMAVVPLRFGAGVKGKVVEAAYFQIPLVTTSIGAEGLSREEGSMAVEDDGEKMADAICSLYTDFETLKAMSDNGEEFIKKYFMIEEAERVLRLDVNI